ncbi:MAG: substrate-binding domain-containing protein [Propionibacteriales bacterium]|nr:substrate-binding domain-containing protein [Propionibacteriales bacterium]
MALTRKTTKVLVGATVAAMAMAGCTQKNDEGGSTSTDSGGGGEVTVAFVPKIQGIPYFEAMNTGGESAAEEIDGLKWVYNGPTSADPASQTQIVRSLIQQKVDTLVVAPNDPDSMAPVLEEAKGQDITVMTSDTDAPNSVREVFVSQASTEGIGKALTDNLMEAMGGKGRYAIVSCGETAENLNSWIEVQEEYTASEYPDAEIVDIVYAGEDQAKATAMAKDLMNANPDLTGLVGECTTSAPGVAQAVQEADKVGKVFTVGLGTPQSMAEYLESGASSFSVLWDVEKLGYLTAWAGYQLNQGNDLTEELEGADNLEGVSYDPETKVLLLGEPLVLTKDNVGDYDY